MDKNYLLYLYILLTIACIIFSLLISSIIAAFLTNIAVATLHPFSIFSLLGKGFSPIMAMFIIVIPLLLFASLLIVLIKPKKEADKPFGDARWATDNEVFKGCLTGEDYGVIIGKYKGRLLVHNQPGHLLLVAPTRSGKGVGYVIPNLLTYRDSIITLDVKGENFEATSGAQAQMKGDRVYKFAPAESRTHCFNPLDFISRDTHDIATHIQDLCSILIPPANHSGNPMWVNEARSLCHAIIHFVIVCPDIPATLGEVRKIIKSEKKIDEMCLFIATEFNIPFVSKSTILAFHDKADGEKSGVKSNLLSYLTLWDNPVVDYATSKTDFDITSFRKEPAALYVTIPISSLNSFSPLLNVFFEYVNNILNRTLPTKEEKHNVLFLIDEFASLGRMDALTKYLGQNAGYGVKLMMVLQGISQLDQHYGKSASESILQNMHTQIYFASTETRMADHISKLLGNTTIEVSSNVSQKEDNKSSQSSSPSSRPLLYPDEINRFDKKKAIICVENERPIIADKIQYFSDKFFKQWCSDDIPPVVIADNHIEEIKASFVEKLMELSGFNYEKAKKARSAAGYITPKKDDKEASQSIQPSLDDDLITPRSDDSNKPIREQQIQIIDQGELDI